MLTNETPITLYRCLLHIKDVQYKISLELTSGLISKYRNPHSLQLAFTLSDQGRDVARLIYADRVKDDLNG